MSLLTVLMDETGNRVLTSPAAVNRQLPKVAFGAKANVVTFIGDLTNTSVNILNISDKDIAKLYVGALVTGTGIPTDATIASINPSANRATLSAAATATNVGLTITQTVSEVTILNSMPPSSMIVKESLSDINTFTT